MAGTERRAASVLLLVTAGCLTIAWVEGGLAPVYPVKSTLKIAIFLGCIGLYTLLSRDYGPFQALRYPDRIKFAALLAAGVFAFLLGGYLILSPWLDLSAIPENLAAKEGITAKTFPQAVQR